MSPDLLTGGEGERGSREPEITDYNYIGSAIGNAFFSGVSFEQLWSCVSMAETREELDEAVSATIRLNEIANDRSGQTVAAAPSTGASAGYRFWCSTLDALRGCADRLSTFAPWNSAVDKQ